MSELLTIGYAEPGAQERIDAFLRENHTGALIDIRLSPRSRWHPAFTRSVLASKYPEQYIWMPEFGNLNYKPEDREKGIEIAAPETGLARILYLLNDPLCEHPLMLMCACKDYEQCHRKVVYELVMAELAKGGATPTRNN